MNPCGLSGPSPALSGIRSRLESTFHRLHLRVSERLLRPFMALLRSLAEIPFGGNRVRGDASFAIKQDQAEVVRRAGVASLRRMAIVPDGGAQIRCLMPALCERERHRKVSIGIVCFFRDRLEIINGVGDFSPVPSQFPADQGIIVGRIRVSLLRCPAKAGRRLRQILRDSLPSLMKGAEIKLGNRRTSLRRSCKPSRRSLHIGAPTLSAGKEEAKIHLRLDISIFRQRLEERLGFRKIAWITALNKRANLVVEGGVIGGHDIHFYMTSRLVEDRIECGEKFVGPHGGLRSAAFDHRALPFRAGTAQCGERLPNRGSPFD